MKDIAIPLRRKVSLFTSVVLVRELAARLFALLLVLLRSTAAEPVLHEPGEEHDGADRDETVAHVAECSCKAKS